jgi:hypothetical protein
MVGGLGLATVVTLYLTPVAYLVIARFTKPACRRGAAAASGTGERHPAASQRGWRSSIACSGMIVGGCGGIATPHRTVCRLAVLDKPASVP